MNPRIRKIGAWLVNLFTASGIIAAFYAVVLISENDFRNAMWLLFLCLFIDGIDGTLARLFRTSEALPWIDGKAIDQVVDFATYAFVPAYLMYQADIFSPSLRPIAVSLILFISAFYYGKKGMVSSDMHFVGFPVLWNFVAFYLVFLSQDNRTFNFAVVLFLGVLHFVPLKFAYPSRTAILFYPTLVISLLCVASCLAILYVHPNVPNWMTLLSLATVLYFAVLAVWVTYLKPKTRWNGAA
jgi:phosphatidylcholine synthase